MPNSAIQPGARTVRACIRRSPTRSSANWRQGACPGSSLGANGGSGAARRAEKCSDRAALFRDEHHHSMVGGRWSAASRARAGSPSARRSASADMCGRARRELPSSMPTASFRTASAGAPRRMATSREAIPFLKRFTVFNTDQCEDLPADLASVPAPTPEGLILPQAEALIAATGADFRIGGDRAFYSPAQDFVQVPPPEAFFEPINWHRTALHELGHWSGLPVATKPGSIGHFGS